MLLGIGSLTGLSSLRQPIAKTQESLRTQFGLCLSFNLPVLELRNISASNASGPMIVSLGRSKHQELLADYKMVSLVRSFKAVLLSINSKAGDIQSLSFHTSSPSP